MSSNRVKVGIVGLGRWAKVLTRAARTSDAIEIVAGFSRSEESRAAFQTGVRRAGARPTCRRCWPIPRSRASS